VDAGAGQSFRVHGGRPRILDINGGAGFRVAEIAILRSRAISSMMPNEARTAGRLFKAG
jgi:hypothetical protein